MTGVASIRWVRPLFTTSANSSALASQGLLQMPERGNQVVDQALRAAMWIALGNTSLLDCDALTWSFG